MHVTYAFNRDIDIDIDNADDTGWRTPLTSRKSFKLYKTQKTTR